MKKFSTTWPRDNIENDSASLEHGGVEWRAVLIGNSLSLQVRRYKDSFVMLILCIVNACPLSHVYIISCVFH